MDFLFLPICSPCLCECMRLSSHYREDNEKDQRKSGQLLNEENIHALF